jgi:hypothetical protein
LKFDDQATDDGWQNCVWAAAPLRRNGGLGRLLQSLAGSEATPYEVPPALGDVTAALWDVVQVAVEASRRRRC